MVEVLSWLWRRYPDNGKPLKVGIVLYDLVAPDSVPLPLFEGDQKRVRLARSMDAVNAKFGANSVYLAGMHTTRDSAPIRIAFGTVPDLNLPV